MPVRWLFPLLAIVVRLAIALATRHVEFDVRVMITMRRALLEYGFHAYSRVPEWVYPPGFMPWVLGGVWIGDRAGLPWKFSLRVPSILADAGLTFFVIDALERRGVGRRLVVIAAGLVAFGPMFLAVSSYQGQIDALAILPAAAAVLWWGRPQATARAVVCGLLIGIGASLKTVPAFMVLALLPTARSMRESLLLVALAAAVPGIALLPFLVADPAGAGRVLQYAGLPGLGGWSLLIQPSLTRAWLAGEPFDLARSTKLLYLCGALASLVALALVAALLIRRRTPAVEAACLIWLTVYTFAVGFFPQYTTWALPFLLMAGRVREVALVSALLVPITGIIVLPRPLALPQLVTVYQVVALAMHLSFVGMWVRDLVGIRQGSRPESREAAI
jgi:uncharacterized membrane protein